MPPPHTPMQSPINNAGINDVQAMIQRLQAQGNPQADIMQRLVLEPMLRMHNKGLQQKGGLLGPPTTPNGM
jgi:hypothetical protein